MTRVVVVLHSAKASGAELATVQYLRRWSTLSPTVVLLEHGPIRDQLVAAMVPVRVVGPQHPRQAIGRSASLLRRLSLLGLGRLGWRLGREMEADLVMAHSVKSALVGAAMAKRLRVPFVWSVHDLVSAAYMGWLNALATRALIRVFADAVVVNSRATLEELGPLRVPSLIRPPGVSLKPRREVADDARTSSGLVVGMVGRLAPWKGQDVFIRAFQQAFRARKDVEGLIVGAAQFGETAYEESLLAAVDAAGIGDRMTFAGHVSDVQEQLQRMDLLVHASVLPEPFGAVVIEGMAAGVALVAADAGGPREVITDGVDGLLYPPGDVAALAERLKLLADDQGLRERLGEAARERARDFDYERLAPLALDWLEALVDGRQVEMCRDTSETRRRDDT